MSKLSHPIGAEWADVPHPVWEAHEVSPPPVNQSALGQTLLFRFVWLYIGIQLLPFDVRFFRHLFDVAGDSAAYRYTRYVFNLAKYAPHFIGSTDTFADWAIVAGLALLGTVVWQLRSRGNGWPDTLQEAQLYAWLRVAVRYRLALAVIAYGFIKLFPLQAPLPSLSNLNTAYGDHTAWKLFSLSLGVVPEYQSFLGGVELLGGLLLLHRKTTVIGTLMLLPFLGNVFFSNLAYEGGEYVYSGLLLTFGLFLFSHDAVRLFRLVSLEVKALPNRLKLSLTPRQQTLRWVLKGAFVGLVVGLYGFTTALTPRTVRFPQTAGLPGLKGLYRVSDYKQNGQSIPYAKRAATRWLDVVFEQWNTISIRSNTPVKLHTLNTEELPADETNRDYQLAGSQGRHYYRYTPGATGQTLQLKNENPNESNDGYTLTLTRSDNGQLLLRGTDARGQAIEATLIKVNKKYLQHEAARAGRRGSLTL